MDGEHRVGEHQATVFIASCARGKLRELALPPGFVDIKVCAVDEVWSGLKLLVRKQLRAG